VYVFGRGVAIRCAACGSVAGMRVGVVVSVAVPIHPDFVYSPTPSTLPPHPTLACTAPPPPHGPAPMQRGHGNAVVSASLDGTVRAFDLTRYRNFRTLTAPTPTQFISLAVDASGMRQPVARATRSAGPLCLCCAYPSVRRAWPWHLP
jgi:hypothetical protein